jgi:hypothetical protein
MRTAPHPRFLPAVYAARALGVLGLAMTVPAAALTAQATGTSPAAARPGGGIGLVLGLGASELAGQRESAAVPSVSSRVAPLGGAYLRLPVGARFAVQPELLYVPKGFRYELTGSTADYALQLDYLELPVLLRAELPRVGRAMPFLYAGPAASLRVRCAFTGEAAGEADYRQDCGEANALTGGNLTFKRFDLGAMVGGGLAFSLGGRALGVGARFSQGLTAIDDRVALPNGTARERKNRVLSLVTSYEFPLGR